MFDDFIVEREPPPNRVGKCDGLTEKHLTEAAVMLSYGMHLLNTVPCMKMVELHPDGEHAKRFEITKFLSARGFVLTESHGSTSYCGTYVCGDKTILVTSKPGLGDVVASNGTETILAECKGGIINTRHPGQSSRLKVGLCEAIGLLMTKPKGGRQVAVVPYTELTSRWALKMAPRAMEAGIEIALVNSRGEVLDVRPNTEDSSRA